MALLGSLSSFHRSHDQLQLPKKAAPVVMSFATADTAAPSEPVKRPTEVTGYGRPRKDVAAIVRSEYPDMAAREASEFATLLTDAGRLVNNCLEDILEPTRSALGEVTQTVYHAPRAGGTGLSLDRVSRLDVKLILSDLHSPIAQKRFTRQVLARLGRVAGCCYGPFHAAVVIENTVLSWDDSSLVVPEPLRPDKEAKFIGRLARCEHPQAEAEVESLAGMQWVELAVSVACEKAMLVYELAELIARYNREEVYDVIGLNCQHFVRDVLRVLRVEGAGLEGAGLQFLNPALQTDFQRLQRGKSVASRRHHSHAELDHYVDEHLWSLTQGELEAVRNVYAKYHRRGRGRRSGEEAEGWACPEADCRLACVQRRLGEDGRSRSRRFAEDCLSQSSSGYF